MILSDKRTVMQEAELAFEHIFEMQAGIERMNRQLAERTDYDSEDYQKLIDRFTHENERFLMMGGTNYRAEMERTLQGLGFSREDFDRSTSEFSGGWRMRIELAKLLLRRPDVLLLDEPTNHLDIESIQWLKNFLSTRANAVVLVSHHRAFLNNVTTRTIEITCGRIYDYKVKYDEFVVLAQGAPGAATTCLRESAEADTRYGRFHRTFPVQSYQGCASAEPHQAARKDRAHRSG